jgi:transposase-like protein
MNTTTIENGAEEAKPNGRRAQPAERAQVLAEWAASGKSAGAMAAITGWSTYTLYRWKNEAAREKRPLRVKRPELVAVPKPKGATQGGWAAEIAIGAASVRLSAGCPADWIGQLVRELRSC